MTHNDEQRGETAVNLGQLRQLLTQQFNKSELHLLAFDLGVEYEELVGSTRSDKVVSLIEYLMRNGRLTDLVTQCRQLRPYTTWPEVVHIEPYTDPALHGQLTPSIQDSFSRYEAGLNKLQTSLGQSHTRYADFLVYQQRLMENLAQTRRYGDTENRRAERAETVDRLNALSIGTTGVSFNKLCQ